MQEQHRVKEEQTLRCRIHNLNERRAFVADRNDGHAIMENDSVNASKITMQRRAPYETDDLLFRYYSQ